MFAVPANTVALAADPAVRHPALIAMEYAADRSRWARLLRYDADERYVRLVERTAAHEIWLMSWLPGQATEPHDHDGAIGAFTVASGSLTESVWRTPGRVERRVLSAGQSRVFGLDYVHQVRNISPDPAVSIHVFHSARRPPRPILPAELSEALAGGALAG